MSETVKRLKVELLEELRFMTPTDLQAYWKQLTSPKPNLVNLAESVSHPLATALRTLAPQILAEASKQLDPFGWLLDAMDVSEWSNYCHKHSVPWMTRVWLAAASQLLAQRKLIHKAHGWGNTWEELRQNQDTRNADKFFFAQFRHANEKRQLELLGTPGLDERLAKARQEKDEAFLRRLRRARQETELPAGVALAEKYMVQHWLELPKGLPGLCFFSDSALDALFEGFRLKTGKDGATKQIRVRLGLIQAGAKRHLIEDVIDLGRNLSFTGRMVTKPWRFDGVISWGERRLWPRAY